MNLMSMMLCENRNIKKNGQRVYTCVAETLQQRPRYNYESFWQLVISVKRVYASVYMCESCHPEN